MDEPVKWGIAIAVFVVAVLAGFGLRKLLGRLDKHAESTAWSWDELALTLGRDLSVPLISLAGLRIALLLLRAELPVAPAVVNNSLLAVLIITVSYAVARLAAGIVTSIALAKTGIAASVSLFANITRVGVLGVGLLIMLGSLGIEITPLLGALGVGGLAVALALQDTLANLFAGVHILASRKVQQGDFVRLDSGEEGWIDDINWRNTTIKEIAGNFVIVPNAKFADAILTNFHRPAQDMSVLVDVGVSYDSDLEHVERVTIEVGREVMRELDVAVTDHQPLVRFNAFGESSIDFRVILRTREFADQYLVVSEFIKRLHRRYRDEGIEIPFPIRTLNLPGGTLNGEQLQPGPARVNAEKP